MANTTFYCPNQTFALLPFLTNGVLTTAFVLFGVTGIGFTCRATLRQSRHTRLGKYLIAMYFWDATLLLASLAFYGLVVLIVGNKPWTGEFVYLYIIFNPICQCTLVATIWLVVVISIERYLALSDPLRHRSRGTKGVKLLCIGIGLFSVVFSLPTVFELTIASCIQGNSSFPVLSATAIRMTRSWLYGYRVAGFGLFVSPTPFLLVLILNVKTLCIPRDKSLRIGKTSFSARCKSLGRRTTRRTESFRQRQRERKIALLLSSMMFKFLLCYILATVVNVAEVISPQFGMSAIFADLVDVSNLLVVIQSSTNWLWFSSCGKSKNPTRTPQSSLRRSMETDFTLHTHSLHLISSAIGLAVEVQRKGSKQNLSTTRESSKLLFRQRAQSEL